MTNWGMSYDHQGRLIDILHRRSSTLALIQHEHYTLDAAGRKTRVDMTTATGQSAQAYVYDDLNRLSQVTYSDDNATIDPTDRVVQYTFDGNGNRLTQKTYAHGLAGGMTQSLSYAYGAENRLLSITDQNNVVQERDSYDWRGNLVMKVTPTATTQFTYDSRNLLTSVDDGTNHTTYDYDGAGRRSAQTVNGVVTRFLINPTGGDVYQTLEEQNAQGQTQASYVYGLDRIAGYLPGTSTSTYYLTDNQNSVKGLVDNSGTYKGGYSYDAYGSILSTTTTLQNPFTYDGERLDTLTGLINLRAREYNPATGRFLQKDPARENNNSSQHLFSIGNPVSFSDPTGKFVVVDDAVELGGLWELTQMLILSRGVSGPGAS